MDLAIIMDFSINEHELSALYGLPHIQQLAYLRGIRPYMDVKTGMVGIKRGISYQSIAEQLYIEPHPGIKSISYSRAQVIRAVAGLQRAGIIAMQSDDLKLILKCKKATLHYSVQNKAVINPSQQAVILPNAENPINTGVVADEARKADTAEPAKAVIPLIKNNNLYIYLSARFEKFFENYPEQKSRAKAWEAFQLLNPSETLFSQMMEALDKQKAAYAAQKSQGIWVAAWKHPANWLANRSWEDAITEVHIMEKKSHAHGKDTGKKDTADPFAPYWGEYAEDTGETAEHNNIVQFNRC